MFLAADYSKKPEMIELLVKSGADIDGRGKDEMTPLMCAVLGFINDNYDVVKKMIDLGADLNARDNNGDTPLFMAAYGNKNPEVIKALLKYGADVNIRDDSGKTALEYTYKNYRARKILLHYKEQINRIDKRKIIK